MKDKLRAREEECLNFLKAIPEETKYVLIGGYAVSSFGFPRFSVDLDIVHPKTELPFFEKLLEDRNFKQTNEKKDIDEVYMGEFRKYEKKEMLPVSVDLLVNAIKARQTDTSYSFDYLSKNSETRTVSGWYPESKTQARISDREMLIALKINSMRLTDQRDIIMLCHEKPDTKKITEHLARCPADIIQKHFEYLLSTIDNPKYVNSVKGVFNLNDNTYNKAIKNAKKTVTKIQKNLQEHKKS